MSPRPSAVPKEVKESDDPDHDSLMHELFPIVSKMKEGVPLICKVESCSPRSVEAAMCLAMLSDDLESIRFVKDSTAETGGEISISSLLLCDVEQVAVSNAGKYAIGLLIPGQEIIMQLIFASDEDFQVWETGLRVLCPKRTHQKEEVADHSASAESCMTEMQDVSCLITSSPMSDLVTLVNELQSQNDNLKCMLDSYEGAVDELKSKLEEEMEAKRSAELEASRLKKLLSLRDDTVTELSDLIQSLIRKQSAFVAMENDYPEEFFIGSARRDRKPKVVNLMRSSARSSPATTVSDTVEVPQVLQSFEDQLKVLEQRKRVLETMLISAVGR